MLPGFTPRLQNAQAISIDITTVLPEPVAILQPSLRSAICSASGEGSTNRGK